MILAKFFSNIPNTITSVRILLILPFIYFYSQDEKLLAFIISATAVLTDFLDGFCARRLGQESDFGALWDPIADKIITQIFYAYAFFIGLIPWYLFLIVFLRNFSQMLSVPILMWWLKRPFYVKVKSFPKWVTAITFCYFFLPLFFSHFFSQQILFWLEVIVIGGELAILCTYLPRFILIATGRHDTFE